MRKNSLGDRMKEYERTSDTKLVRRLPMIVRLDGKAFHSWTKKSGCVRPFDHTFIDMMAGLAQYLCENTGGAERSWEVTQVNELLYRMENFNGIFIGATNRNDSLDPAVLRRFTFKVEFDALDTVGKQKFFERTFGTLLTAGERTRLHEIENVTPGDFRTVRQRLFYLGGEVDNEMRIMAIEQECANKRAFHRGRIGF